MATKTRSGSRGSTRMAGICWPRESPRCLQVLPLQALAATDVEDVRVGGRDGHGADRAGRLVVEDGLPGSAEVVGLPDAAVADADVEDAGLAADAHGGDGPAAAERADHAPAQAVIQLRGQVLGVGEPRRE